jgi:hypothetical protein
MEEIQSLVGGIWVVAALSLLGCSSAGDLPTDGELDSNEPVAEVTEELSSCTCDRDSYLPITVNNESKTGPTRSANMCWPTSYARRSSGPNPSLIVDDLNGNWRVTGTGAAHCLPRCCFKSNNPGAARTLSNAFAVSATTNSPLSIELDSTPLVPGALQFLNGIRHLPGNMVTSEGAYLIGDALNAQATVNCIPFLCPTHTTEAVAYSLYVGAPTIGTHVVRKQEFTLTAEGVVMTPLNEGACTISRMLAGGSGQGHATLSRIRNNWIGVLSNGGSAQATCYLYDQTN